MYLYASGVVSSLESKLLKKETLDKLLNSVTEQELINNLSQTDYEELLNTQNNLDSILKISLKRLFEFIKKQSPSKQVTSFFLTPLDFDNVQTLIKYELLKKDCNLDLIEGEFSIKQIKTAINQKKFNCFSKHLNKTLEDFYELNISNDSAKVDLFFKKRKYQALKEIFKKGIIKELCFFDLDITNICILARSNDINHFKSQMVECGSLNLDILEELFNKKENALYLIQDDALRNIAKNIFDMIEDEKNVFYPKEMFFLKKLKPKKNEINTEVPFINYIFEKMIEIRNLSMVFNCFYNNIEHKPKIIEY